MPPILVAAALLAVPKRPAGPGDPMTRAAAAVLLNELGPKWGVVSN